MKTLFLFVVVSLAPVLQNNVSTYKHEPRNLDELVLNGQGWVNGDAEEVCTDGQCEGMQS